MPRAFVITGGSRSQLGLLENARALGYDICVVDQSPGAPLLAEAEHPIVRTFTDVEGVLAELREREIEPVAVATMGSDLAVLPTALLAAELGLPGLPVGTAEIVADKRKMRTSFEAAGVPCPRGRKASTPAEAAAAFAELGPPVVVKPVDGSGQRGVTRVGSQDELAFAFERALAASRSGVAVLEDYLKGEEYTVNGFLLDGDYSPMSVTQRLLYAPPPLGVCAAHRYPSGLSGDQCRELFELARVTSTSVGIETGASYVQVRLDCGTPSVIEVGARLGGGKDAELAKLVSGFDALRANVLLALGQLTKNDLREDPSAAVAPCGQVTFVFAPSGRIVRLDATPALALEGVHEAGFYWREGMTLPPLTSGAERLGYLLVSAADEDELDARTSRALEALDLEIAVETLV